MQVPLVRLALPGTMVRRVMLVRWALLALPARWGQLATKVIRVRSALPAHKV
jgi:hypothetical protein